MSKNALNAKNAEILRSMADNLFNLESAVKSILTTLQNDINHSIQNETIPDGAGQINIYINKTGDEYVLSMKSNGTGINTDQLSDSLRVVGRSSQTAQDPYGVWILAPFHLNPESYTLRSNPRDSDESLSVESKPSGFSVMEDGTEYDFFGTEIELEIDSVEYTVPQIGSKIREVSNSNIEVPTIYEVRENGTVKKQEYINFS